MGTTCYLEVLLAFVVTKRYSRYTQVNSGHWNVTRLVFKFTIELNSRFLWNKVPVTIICIWGIHQMFFFYRNKMLKLHLGMLSQISPSYHSPRFPDSCQLNGPACLGILSDRGYTGYSQQQLSLAEVQLNPCYLYSFQ